MKWPLVRIIDFCITGSGSTPSRSNYSENFGGTIPWIKSGELKDEVLTNAEEYVTENGVKEARLKLVPREAVLVAMYGATVGRTALLDFEATTNQAVCHIIPEKNKATSKYLWYALRAKLPELLLRRVGGAQPNINQQIIQNTLISLPPIPEQKRIVAILDKADAVRRKRQEMIRLLDEFLRSMFLEMFGDPVRNEKGWEKKRLEQACIKITDGTHSSPPNFPQGDYPYITAKNIKKQGIDLSELTYISKDYHKEIFQRCNPEKGDILYIKDGVTTGIAQVNILDFEFSMLSSVALLKLNASEITPYYLREVLNNDSLYAYIRGQMGGAAITRLTLNKINNIPIPIPPIEIQRRFNLIVQETEKQKELMRKSLTEMENSFNSLIQKAFWGEL